MRLCMVCCACIEHRRPQATVCESKVCLKEKQLAYSKGRYQKKKGDKEFKAKREALRKTPKAKYRLHKQTAKDRGIEFLLTFEECGVSGKPNGTKEAKLRACVALEILVHTK